MHGDGARGCLSLSPYSTIREVPYLNLAPSIIASNGRLAATIRVLVDFPNPTD